MIESPGTARVFVAGGSNVEPQRNLAIAMREMARSWPDVQFSRAYRNIAVGFEGPDFINWVAGFRTDWPIDQVLARLHAIEALCGRARHAPKWAPRSMDLDVLLFDDAVATTREYQLPRPDLVKRAYMLGPMAEIAPEVTHPTLGLTMGELWQRFDRDAHPLQQIDLGLTTSG